MKLDPTLVIAVALVAWWYLRDAEETIDNSTLTIEVLNGKGERVFIDPPRRSSGSPLRLPTTGAIGAAAEFTGTVLAKPNPNDKRGISNT